MARASSEIETILFLELSTKEARYLRDQCQNYLGSEVESDEDNTIRINIFEELKQELIQCN